MRPTSELLDHFSKLAELKQDDRTDALAAMAEQQTIASDPELNKYCLERLITGLASARAASRVGFSTAFLMLLTSEAGESWTLEKVLEVANKKMDLSDKSLASGHAIGHYLLLCTMVHSDRAYGENVPNFIEHLKKVKDTAPILSFALTKLFTDYSLLLKESDFNNHAAPYAKQILESTNVAYTPENVYYSLSIRKKYSQLVAKNVKFVKKDGSCSFPEDSYPKLLLAIKRCDSSKEGPFNTALLAASSECGNFEKLFSTVFEPWALASNETKVLERIFGVVYAFFDLGKVEPKLIVSIFTKEVINRMEMAMKGKGQFRFLRDTVQKFGAFVKTKLEELKGKEAYEALKELERRGNVDRACGISLTTTLLANLDKKNVKTWVQDNINSQEELRKIVSAFSSWNEQSRVAVLTTLLAQKATETIQIVVTSIVDSLFYVKTRAGEFASIQLSEHNEQILRQLVVTAGGGEDEVKKAEKVIGLAKERQKSLLILWLVTRLWAVVSPNPEDSASYNADSDEILAIAKNESDKNNSKVFVDLLIGILSREKKFHRTPVAFAFAHALPSLKSKDLVHIVETAMMSEKELIDEEDDEDMEDEEGMPFDESDIPKKSAENDEDEDEDDSDSDEEDGEDANESVDQELLNKLNVALGDAAADKEDNSDQEMDDLDDEEMQKMDERLAAAFKMMAPKGFGRKQKTRNVEALKMKIADILLIAISSKDVSEDNKLKLIIPLLRWAKTDLKSHDKVAQRAIELINVIVGLKMTEVSEKKTIQLMKDVIEESQNATNLFVVDIVARVIAFVLKISSKDELNVSEGVRAEFWKLFEQFFKNVEGKVPADFVIKPIVEQPKLFINDLKLLTDAGFDENNRIFKRTEVLNAVSVICSKIVLKEVDLEKSVVKNLAKLAGSYLEKVVEEDSSEVKPRYFATVLRVLFNLAASITENPKLTKVMREGLEATIAKMTNGEVLAKMKKMNSACQQVVGKNFPATIAQIRKNLEIEIKSE